MDTGILAALYSQQDLHMLSHSTLSCIIIYFFYKYIMPIGVKKIISAETAFLASSVKELVTEFQYVKTQLDKISTSVEHMEHDNILIKELLLQKPRSKKVEK